MNPNINPKGVKNPFRHFCMSVGAIPTSYKESLSYYETLLWLIRFLEEKVIPAVDNNAQALEELQDLFIQLKNYVDNYFDNLDVQQEINNKLDEMVESGELQEIIGEFLDSTALWCFENLTDMKNASNLKDGSYAKIVGLDNVNDGYSAVYYIRTKLSSDIIDNNNIILMSNNTLVAEKIKNTCEYLFPGNFENAYSGDCNIIRYNNKIIMIDTYSPTQWTNVKNFIDSYNITHIDYLVITHYHGDHVGNFENLVTNGYVNSDTKLYFPAEVTNWVDYAETPDYYKNYCEEHNLDYYVPYENEILRIGDLKITFYNCNAELLDLLYYTNSATKNYNNCSTVLKIEHGDVLSLYTADILIEGINRLYDTNFVNRQVDLYKIEHHGIESTTNKQFIEKISPKYAYQPAGILDYQVKVLFARCEIGKFLDEVECKNYIMFQNEDNVEFISDGSNIHNVKGYCGKISNRTNTVTYYVDSSVTLGDKCDGSSAYPFNSINQALASAKNNACENVVINLADGDYRITDVAFKRRPYVEVGLDTKVTLNGNSTDRTKVIIDGLYINGSNIEVNNITIDVDSFDGISSYNSNIKLYNCIFTSLTSTVSTHSCIIVRQNTKIDIDTCKIDYGHEGLIATDSILNIRNLTVGTNNNNKFNINKSNIAETDNLIFDVASDKLVNNFDRKVVNSPQLIWEGSSFESITLQKSLSNFDWIEIIYGDDTQNTIHSTGRIYGANGKRIYATNLSCETTGKIYINIARIEFSNTSITVSRNLQKVLNADGSISFNGEGNFIKLLKIIGGFNDYIDKTN